MHLKNVRESKFSSKLIKKEKKNYIGKLVKGN